MSENLLKIATILRPHGIKGYVKVECLVDDGLENIREVFVGREHTRSSILNCSRLNKDFYMVQLDLIKDIDTAEKYRNADIYIDRTKYDSFKDKLYLSDLINKPLISTTGEELGLVIDYDDYGASVVLTIKCGAVSYQIPYVSDIVKFDVSQDAFVIDKATFEGVRV